MELSGEDKFFLLMMALLIGGLTALGALDSWEKVERSRHGCAEEKE